MVNQTTKSDSAAYIVQSLLNEHLAANWVDRESSSHGQAPAPGSLALDPALNAGFEGSSLEQLTSDLLAATQVKESQRTAGEMIRWDEMATHPIFEVETSFTVLAAGDEHKPAVTLNANTTARKRVIETVDVKEEKRQRVEQAQVA